MQQVSKSKPKSINLNEFLNSFIDMEKIHPTILMMFLGGLASVAFGVYAPSHTPIELRTMALAAGAGAMGAVQGITNYPK